MDNKLLLAVTFNGIDKLTGPIRNIIGAGKTGAMALKGMRTEARDLAQQLKDVRRQIEGGSGNLTQLINRERELARASANANMELARQKQHLAQISRIEAVGAQIAARSQALKDRGQENVVGGAAMLGPLLLAVRSAGQFQDGMIDIRQKANLTAAETDRMQRSILDAAIAARQLPEDMRRGVDTLSGFGMDPRQAMQIIAPIGRFVTGYRADMAEVGQATFAGIDNLKVPLGQATRLLEIMAFAGKAGAFEAKDLARTMPALSAAYQGLGQTGTAAFAQLAAGAEIARKGAGNSEVAGNNLLNLLNKLTSVETIKNFAKQGIDLEKALKDSKDPLETIVLLAQKATGGDTMKLNTLFQDMQVLGALRPMLANLPEYRRIRDEALKSTGTLDKDFAIRAQGAGANWNLLMGNLQKLAIVSGTLLLPVMNQVVTSISGVVQRVADWAQANPELAGALLKGVGYLAAFRIALGAVQIGAGFILGPIGKAATLFLRFQNFGGITGILMRIAGGFQAAMVAARGFNLAMLANPIGLVVIAVGAAAYLIWTYWDKIKSAFVNNWTQIRNVCLGAIVIFMPLVAAVIYVGSLIYRNWDKIKAATMSMVRTVGGIVEPFIRPFVIIGGYLGGLAGKFFGFGANIISGLIRGIVSMAGSVISAIWNLAEKVGASFAAALGIKSPSRLFMAFGGHITEGLAIGLDRGGKRPLRSLARITAGLGGGTALALASPAFASGPGGAGPAPGARTGSPPLAVTYNVTIQLTGSGDTRADAQAIKRELDALLAVEARGSYADD